MDHAAAGTAAAAVASPASPAPPAPPSVVLTPLLSLEIIHRYICQYMEIDKLIQALQTIRPLLLHVLLRFALAI